MQLRWSPAAVEDLFRIIEYIQQENPAAAQRIAKTIYESAGSLKSFPNKGRAGRVEGTRELPLPPLPFVVVYRERHPWRTEMAARRLKLAGPIPACFLLPCGPC
jgi:toxin ParE1/3/4